MAQIHLTVNGQPRTVDAPPMARLLDVTQHLQRPLHVRDATFKKAPRSRPSAAENLSLALTDDTTD